MARRFRNTRRENRLEELGRVDAERAHTSRGKRNLREEKDRIRSELAIGGVAKSAQYKKTGAVAVSIFGDGATNIGAFHEGLNIAQVLNLPAIFICENNLYGEYSPLATTTPVLDLATRANSYNMRNYIVDGLEVEEVIKIVKDLMENCMELRIPSKVEPKLGDSWGYLTKHTPTRQE